MYFKIFLISYIYIRSYIHTYIKEKVVQNFILDNIFQNQKYFKKISY